MGHKKRHDTGFVAQDTCRHCGKDVKEHLEVGDDVLQCPFEASTFLPLTDQEWLRIHAKDFNV